MSKKAKLATSTRCVKCVNNATEPKLDKCSCIRHKYVTDITCGRCAFEKGVCESCGETINR